MIRWLLCMVFAFSLTVSQAQSPPSGTPGFSLQDLLGGLNLDEIMETLDEELNVHSELLDGILGSGTMDSALNMLQQGDLRMSFDTIFQQMDKYFLQESGWGSMIDQFLQQLNDPVQNMPLPGMNAPPVSPEELDEGGWEIVPNVPKPPASAKGVKQS